MWIQPQVVLGMCKCAMQYLNSLWNEVVFLQHLICIMKSLNLALLILVSVVLCTCRAPTFIQEPTNTLNFWKITSHVNMPTFSVVTFLYIIWTRELRRNIELQTDLFKWLYERQVLEPCRWQFLAIHTEAPLIMDLMYYSAINMVGWVGMWAQPSNRRRAGSVLSQNTYAKTWGYNHIAQATPVMKQQYTLWQTMWWNYSHNTEADTNRTEVRRSRTH